MADPTSHQPLQDTSAQVWKLGPGGYRVGPSRDQSYVLFHVDGPPLHEQIEVVPREVAERLAQAVEEFERWEPAKVRRALAEYRAVFPKACEHEWIDASVDLRVCLLCETEWPGADPKAEEA